MSVCISRGKFRNADTDLASHYTQPMMVPAIAIKATNVFDTCEKRRSSSQIHSTSGRVVLCAQHRMAPSYPARLRINAQPQLHTSSLSLSQVTLGDRLAFDTTELKLARFKRAVILVSDAILDPETARTPDLLPGTCNLSVLSRSKLELELHLCLSHITPYQAAAYVLAGANVVTFHLESFVMPNMMHGVDYDALIACMEAVCNAGGTAGIAVFPTLSPNAALKILGESGYLELLSHLTIFMGDIALNSSCGSWRYIPAMEDKVRSARETLGSLGFSQSGHVQIVVYGKFNTVTVARAALAEVDSITITDLSDYGFFDERYGIKGMRCDVQEADVLRRMELYGRPNASVAAAVHHDAMHRATAARNIKRHLARQWPESKHPRFGTA